MHRLPRTLIPLALCLSACAGQSATSTPQACTAQKAAEIPVSTERGFVTAQAQIQGHPVTMIVDTGAERLMVTPSAMAALALSPDRHRRTTIHGTGGTVVSQNAAIQSFGIGGLEMLDQSAAVAPLPVLAGPSLHASGLLGADWLSDFDVEFDLPHRRVALYRVSGCASDYVPWGGTVTSARLQLLAGGLPLVPVTLDGHELTALLDSGAASTTLSEASATRIGVTPNAPQDRKGHSVGVDGTIRESYVHRFNDLAVAGRHTVAPQLTVSSLTLPTVDMLLGADWLGHNRVWINYAGHRVSVQPEP